MGLREVKLGKLVMVCVGAVLVVGLAGCQKLSARMELKKGNSHYKQEAYRDALEEFQKDWS